MDVGRFVANSLNLKRTDKLERKLSLVDMELVVMVVECMLDVELLEQQLVLVLDVVVAVVEHGQYSKLHCMIDRIPEGQK